MEHDTHNRQRAEAIPQKYIMVLKPEASETLNLFWGEDRLIVHGGHDLDSAEGLRAFVHCFLATVVHAQSQRYWPGRKITVINCGRTPKHIELETPVKKLRLPPLMDIT